MNPSSTETELKLHLASEDAQRMAAAEVGEAAPRELLSFYYDTPEQHLRKAGWSVRVRRDGETWTQAVKGPVSGGQSRFEREMPTEENHLDLRALKTTPAADLVPTLEELRPVFQTQVRRRSQIRRTGNAEVEVSLDEGEVRAAERRSPILEFELELKSGAADALFEDARRLAAAAPFTLDLISKAERGYRLHEDSLREPLKFEPPKVTPELAAGALLQAVFRSILRQLSENAALFLEASRPEAVHQARVALRRLRVVLGVFKEMLPKERRVALAQELVWLTSELATARDLDVFAEDRVHPALEEPLDREAFAVFADALRRARSAAYENCRSALSSPRFRLLLLEAAEFSELGDWIRAPLTADAAAEPASRFGRVAVEHQWRRFGKLERRTDWRDPDDVHRLRIAAKKLRYVSDLFEDLAKDAKSFSSFSDELKALQDGLGAVNDLRMAPHSARLVLGEAAERDQAAAAGLAAGVLIAESERRRTKSVKAAKKDVRRFLDRSPWW